MLQLKFFKFILEGEIITVLQFCINNVAKLFRPTEIIIHIDDSDD